MQTISRHSPRNKAKQCQEQVLTQFPNSQYQRNKSPMPSLKLPTIRSPSNKKVQTQRDDPYQLQHINRKHTLRLNDLNLTINAHDKLNLSSRHLELDFDQIWNSIMIDNSQVFMKCLEIDLLKSALYIRSGNKEAIQQQLLKYYPILILSYYFYVSKSLDIEIPRINEAHGQQISKIVDQLSGFRIKCQPMLRHQFVDLFLVLSEHLNIQLEKIINIGLSAFMRLEPLQEWRYKKFVPLKAQIQQRLDLCWLLFRSITLNEQIKLLEYMAFGSRIKILSAYQVYQIFLYSITIQPQQQYLMHFREFIESLARMAELSSLSSPFVQHTLTLHHKLDALFYLLYNKLLAQKTYNNYYNLFIGINKYTLDEAFINHQVTIQRMINH